MKLLSTSEYKNLTDQELDLLIAETEKYIKYLYNLCKSQKKQNESSYNQHSTQMMEINVFRFENDNIDYKKEIINYEIQYKNLIKVKNKRELFEYYSNTDIFENFNCDVCGELNDLEKDSQNSTVIEYRGICCKCGESLFKEIKRDF